MLIACRFKRPKAPVELGEKTYFFTPIDPSSPDSEHVAEITDNEHIQRLLSIPEGYYIAEAQSLPTVARPAVVTLSQPTNIAAGAGAGAGDQNGTGQAGLPAPGAEVVPLPEELAEAASALNELSWQKLQAELKKGGIDKVVIKAALDIEKAKPDADQRATTLRLLAQALEAA